MPAYKRIQGRGVRGFVEANAEVLFTGAGPVGRWTNRLSQRVRANAARFAPSNSRPRWAHYGAPLKRTMRAKTDYDPARMKVFALIGSTAPHSLYVDQGTGIYGGNGPYEAKILPPWSQGSPSLYERTWRAGPNGPQASPVMIKGQRGQFFFDRALAAGLASMRMRAFQVPGDMRIGRASESAINRLSAGLGNTPANAAFRASLEEWRSWRDRAFNRGEVLGEGSNAERRRRDERRYARRAASRERRDRLSAPNKRRRAEESKVRSQKRRDRLKAQKELANKAQPQRPRESVANVRAREKSEFLAAVIKKFGAKNVDRASLRLRSDGVYEVLVKDYDGATGRFLGFKTATKRASDAALGR